MKKEKKQEEMNRQIMKLLDQEVKKKSDRK